MSRKVIFLDVDGVLITRKRCMQGYGIVEPRCVEAINSLLEQSGAAIVLSSCWRVGKNPVECRELLANWGVKGTVLDRTPMTNYSDTRGDEIQRWIDEYKRHRDIEAFAIIDDDSDMGELLPYLVKTDMENGFTVAHIPKVLDVLAACASPKKGEENE